MPCLHLYKIGIHPGHLADQLGDLGGHSGRLSGDVVQVLFCFIDVEREG
jgi:hypothetical protein